jgi:hypothetical protein
VTVRTVTSRPAALQRCGGHVCPPEGCDGDRLSRAASGPARATAPAVVYDVLAQPGDALPAGVRAPMEHRLGHDFASVRVHTGQLADAAARSVAARAFTVGRHVVVARGEWAPGTTSGDQLVAHELTHVVQQSGGSDHVPDPLPVVAENDPTEDQARDVAHQRGARGAAGGSHRHVARLPFGITLPTGVRGLDPTEQAIGSGVYRGSINWSKVLLSNATGGGGRPFTTAAPLGNTVINIGPSAYATPGSNPSLLIHELAHVWQSQHHPSPVSFMGNSVASQAAAAAAGGSAYCYVPGKSFGSYAAEQVAQSAENGEAPIISHMAGVSAGAIDFQNILSLSVPRWETPAAPGVKC